MSPSKQIQQPIRVLHVDDDSSFLELSQTYLELHCAARVDGEHKHPLGATATEGDTHESPQCDHLKDDIEVFADFDSIIWVCDRGYTHYPRFCHMKHSDDDFVTLLQSDARLDVLESYCVPSSGQSRSIAGKTI